MKKLLTLFMLVALPALGQRSISVTTNGLTAPASWGMQNAPTNIIWTGAHENRAIVTNTSAGAWFFQGGVTMSTFTNVNQRSTGWAVTPIETNTTAFRAEGGFTVTGIATNQNVRVPGWEIVTGNFTNSGAGRFESTLAVVGVLTLSDAISFPDGVRQTFNPNGTAAGLNVGSQAGDPASPSNGDVWYDSTANELTARINGANVALGAAGAGTDATKIATNAGSGWSISLNLRTTINGNFADTATNLTHATHNEYVINDHRLARMSMGADMIVGIVHPTSATAAGMIGRVRVLSTGGAITWSNVTGRSAIPMNTGTNMFYVHWDGTNCWVEAGQLATTGSGDHLVLSNAPTVRDMVMINSAQMPNGSSVTTDAFGEFAGDNNAWAASRGAVQFFDGTANTLLVGVLASDTPSDLQVPKFNSATGTITWENDNNSGAATALNDIADPTADGEVAMAGFRQSYTSTLNGGVANTITNSVADITSDTFLQEWTYRDNADANAFFWKATHNAGATLAASLSSTAFQLNVASSNSSTALVSGNAGFGGNVTSAGEFIGAYNGATAGSTLKLKSFLWLKGPDLVQNGGMLPNTNDVTAVTFGKVRFSNSADEASNYAEYHVMVPEDIDTSVDLRARVIFRLTGADTGTHRYVLSLDDVANSGAYTGTVGNAINLDFAGDGSGASGDVESVGLTTLTGWAGAMTAGRHLVIRIARDGNATEDGSTVDSDLSIVGIEYGVSQ
jgi:hypothetical protein